MGSFPRIPRPPLDLRIEGREPAGGHTRVALSFVAEPGDRVPAWLLLPAKPLATGAAAICLHQTTRMGKDEPAGLGGKPDLHYAKELADLGFVSLAPDYPRFGANRTDAYAFGYASNTMKGIWNHSRAVDVLETVAGVNPRRIGAIGHSLGGHNSLFLAAFEPRIAAVATSCGFNSFHKYMKGDLTGWSHAGYMPRIAALYGKSAARIPFDFTDVLDLIGPRPVFVNAPVGDSNFEVSGVRDVVAGRGWVEAHYPEAGHDFPPDLRKLAYGFLERHLIQ